MKRNISRRVPLALSAVLLMSVVTPASAKIAGRVKRLGTLEAGKLAELTLVNGEPLAEMSNIRRVVLTVKGSVIYEAHEMQEAIDVTQ